MLKASTMTELASFDTLDFYTRVMITKAAAYSPNAQYLPFMGDLPWVYENGEIVFKDTAWKQWLSISLTNDDLLQDYVSERDKIKNNPIALMFDLGSGDRYVGSNERFSAKLNASGIEHKFEVYDGNHLNRIHERITKSMLPFFSLNLAKAEKESKGFMSSRYSLLYKGTALLLVFLLIRRLMRRGRKPVIQDENY